MIIFVNPRSGRPGTCDVTRGRGWTGRLVRYIIIIIIAYFIYNAQSRKLFEYNFFTDISIQILCIFNNKILVFKCLLLLLLLRLTLNTLYEFLPPSLNSSVFLGPGPIAFKCTTEKSVLSIIRKKLKSIKKKKNRSRRYRVSTIISFR